jgi:hypothetical protein
MSYAVSIQLPIQRTIDTHSWIGTSLTMLSRGIARWIDATLLRPQRADRESHRGRFRGSPLRFLCHAHVTENQ